MHNAKTSKMRKHRQNFHGRTRKKGGIGNSETLVHGDPFHNGQIPLCRLLSDAIEDIFPELQDQGTSNQSQPQAESGSILGRMIRKRCLLSRKSHRSALDAKFKIDQIGDDLAWDFQTNNNNHNINPPKKIANDDTPPASTTTKKRRKRKKKKRQGSEDPILSSFVSHESTKHDFGSEPHSIPGIDSYMADGKSMMSHTDHSLEALDEAVKNEAEKLIELEANHELPLLGSFPSDDNVQAQESPSQFIDQIKPQDEHLLKSLPEHMEPLPLTDTTVVTTLLPSLEVDNIPENDEAIELKWKNPLQLDFLVNFEVKKEENQKDCEAKCKDESVCQAPKNLATVASDKERGRIILNEWIDQSFFANDESECIETSMATNTDQDDCDVQKDEWKSFLQFCNDRTVGKEKALGIPLGELLEIGSSIECGVCRKDTMTEINKITVDVSESEKSSRVILNPDILEPPPTPDDKSIDAAFDYVAMEEGHHIPKNGNVEEKEDEKSDSNLSFLVRDVTIDPKQKKSANKNGNKKKNNTSSVARTERCLYLESFISTQLEEFLSEWLIAGVDEEKLVQTCVRIETGPREDGDGKATFPVVTTEAELQKIKNGTIDLQISLKETLDDMDMGLDKMKSEWRSKDASKATELNLDFSGNQNMENCEENFNMYLAGDILPILTGDFSLQTHACPELQIHLWAIYLEGLGKTLAACDVYYKKLEEDLADQNGKLPLIFTSAPFRKVYRELAEEKIEFLSELRNSFSSALSSCSMKEFYTRCSWEQCNQDEQDISSQKLDDDCRQLIIELTEWTRIVNGGRMSAINKERSKGLVLVFNLLKVVVESLDGEYKTVERYFSEERQNYFSRLLSNIHLAHGVKHRMRLIEMDDVISLTTGIILMWRHVRIMQSRVDHSISTDMLPLSLRKWVLESPSNDLKPKENYQWSNLFHEKCWVGVGGRRRVMGILAGLTYAWFRERCKEWKAEKASQELLTYIDTDLFSERDPQIGNANKSGKKSKKKKNKKSSNANTAVNSNENNDEAKADNNVSPSSIKSILDEQQGSEDVSVDKSSEVAKDETASPMMLDSNSLDQDPNIDSQALGSQEEGKEDYSNDNEVAETIDNGAETDVLHSENEGTNSTEHYESQIVVQDESGCLISAMEFLTDRLLQVLNQPENGKISIVSS